MARALGITFGGLTMDNTSATYSSVNMDNASIWPIVTRRRSRTAAPFCQAYYEAVIDEEIGEGRLPFKGGYAAFDAHREDALWTLWNGPAKPTADDGKSAKAATERLLNGTSTFEAECAERGLDPEEVFESRRHWHQRFVAAWPELAARYGERFKRMWEFWLLSSAAAFRARRIQLWQVLLSTNGVAGGLQEIR